MKQFRQFLNHHRGARIISLLITASCATQTREGATKNEIAVFQSVSQFYGPQDREVKKRCDGAKKECKPEDIFGIYCHKNKQIRPLTTKLQAILSQAPAGIPIDEAAKFREFAITKIRQAVRDYYLWGLPGNHTFADRSEVVYDSSQACRYGLPLVGEKFRDQNSWRTYLKSSRFREQMYDNIPILISDQRGSNPILIGMNRPNFYDPRQLYTETDDFVLYEDESCAEKLRLSYVFGEPSLKSIPVRIELRTKSIWGPSVYPLRPTVPREPPYLWFGYTMLIPASVQQALFKQHLKELENYEVNVKSSLGSFKGFFVRDDGSFNVTEAIKERQRLWWTYIVMLTSVKEAQSDDPQVINFETSLDLAPFCAYARRIDDLVTK